MFKLYSQRFLSCSWYVKRKIRFCVLNCIPVDNGDSNSLTSGVYNVCTCITLSDYPTLCKTLPQVLTTFVIRVHTCVHYWPQWFNANGNTCVYNVFWSRNVLVVCPRSKVDAKFSCFFFSLLFSCRGRSMSHLPRGVCRLNC